MSGSDREPIIDPMLEELLGGQSPPNLTQRILHAYAAGESVADRAEQTDVDAPGNGELFPKVVAHNRKPSKRKPVNWASAAVVLVGASLILVWALQQHANFVTEYKGPEPKQPVIPAVPKVVRTQPEQDPLPPVEPDPVPQFDKRSDMFAEIPYIDPAAYENQKSPEFKRAVELQLVSPDDRIIQFTNDQLEAEWKKKSVSPAEFISDREWYVRACRFLTGQDPTFESVRNFGRRRDRDREKAVASFLSLPEFTVTWSKTLGDMFVGQFSDDNSTFNRDQLVAYLSESLKTNKPYDQLAFELITAVGSNDSTRSDFNPASNFLLAYQTKEGHKTIEATNIICQVFLGKQMQCAQCHQHPSTTWSQEQYWQLSAFLVQMKKKRLGAGTFQLVNYDFTGNQGTPERAELVFTRQDGKTASAFPVFIDGRSAESQSGVAAEFNRRESLAKMIVSSEDFSKAIVNRLWDQAFGNGLTYPVDDIGNHNPASHPALLSRLAIEFENSGYDIRSVLRWMTLSSAFGLQVGDSSRPELFSTFKQSSPKAYPLIGNTIRQLADSGQLDPRLHLARPDDAKSVSEQQKTEETKRFNEKLRDKLLNTSEGGLLRRIADNQRMSEGEKIAHLFLSIIGRRPTEYEGKQSLRILRSDSHLKGLQHIGYILFNSKEFAVQH